MPFAEEVLRAADAAAQDGIAEGVALPADGIRGQDDDEGDASPDNPRDEVMDEFRRRLKDAGDVLGAETVQQIPRYGRDREERPEPVDPAAQRLPNIGGEDRGVGKEVVDLE